jgi:cytochrome c peroxidase
LGEKFFHDTQLSKNGTQSCATCHNPEHAFIDSRNNRTSHDTNGPASVSLGQDQTSLGDINTPSAAYAAFVPKFHFDEKEKLYIGGLFLNGRARDLQEQAQGPFLNPLEMQNTKEQVVKTVQHKYNQEMKVIYGPDVFQSKQKAFQSIADCISQFETTKTFAPFDSKFDKVLRGEASFSAEEQLGHELFINEEKSKCSACHTVPTKESSKRESLFTDFSYDNLGLPKNKIARNKNGLKSDHRDLGLYQHPEVTDPGLKGAFRVPSLRNIAVTAPYMHNGVFKDLETVVQFYNTRDVEGALNPETHQPWREAEVSETKNTEELGDLKLTDTEVKAIVAFLKTLTDERYEHLLR